MNISFLFLFVFRKALIAMPGPVFWPYFAGITVLALGLAMLGRNSGERRGPGIESAVRFGPVFFVAPLAVFGGDHFIAPAIVAAMIPSWIPGHLFWTYFVGTALFAAALSIVVDKYSTLAATLVGLMIFSFVLILHVPNVVGNPRDRILIAVLLRDLSFSAGALALALTRVHKLPNESTRIMRAALRFAVGIPILFFGVEHFLHPQFVPVVPLQQPMPTWVPAPLFVSYVTGIVMIACAGAIISNWEARRSAIWLGVFVFAMVLFVYLPLVIAKPLDIGNGLNYFADTLAVSGTLLLLGGALPARRETASEHSNETVTVAQSRAEVVG